MSEPHKYSLDDIDAVRAAIREVINYSNRGSYLPSERAAEVEDQLRTCMQNGTRPEELAQQASRLQEAYFAAQKSRQEYYAEQQRKHSEKYPERPRPDGVLSCLRVEDQQAKAFGSGSLRFKSLSQPPLGATIAAISSAVTTSLSGCLTMFAWANARKAFSTPRGLISGTARILVGVWNALAN